MGFQEKSFLSTDLSLNIHSPITKLSSITNPNSFFLDQELKPTMGSQPADSVSTDLSLNILGPVKTTSFFTKPKTFFLDNQEREKTLMGFQPKDSVSTDLSLNILGPVKSTKSLIIKTEQQPFVLDDCKFVPLIKTTMELFQDESSTVSTALSLNIHGPVIVSSTAKKTSFVLDDDHNQHSFQKRLMPQVHLVEGKKRKFEQKVQAYNYSKWYGEDEKTEKKKRKITKRERGPAVVNNVLPEKLEQFIESDMINGVDIKLVIQKKLFASDVNPGQNRLNLPINKLVTHEFLRADEKENLEKTSKDNTIKVQLVGPTLQMYNKPITFKRWKQRCTYNYVLITSWNHFVEDHKDVLKEGTEVQVWSFRRNQQLCFAIVVVESSPNDDMNRRDT